MSAFAAIQATLMSAWQGVGITHPVAFEGRDFSPPSNAPWVALHTLPATALVAAIGASAPIEHVGLLQIDLNYPLDSGTGAILADADTVAKAFAPGATFTHDSQRLVFEYCERSQMLRDEQWLTLHMTAKWRAWEQR